MMTADPGPLTYFIILPLRAVASIEMLLVLAIVGLVAVALYDGWPTWSFKRR